MEVMARAIRLIGAEGPIEGFNEAVCIFDESESHFVPFVKYEAMTLIFRQGYFFLCRNYIKVRRRSGRKC